MSSVLRALGLAASSVIAFAAWEQRTDTFLSGAGVAVWTIAALCYLVLVIKKGVAP
jgi:hypothetical protein